MDFHHLAYGHARHAKNQDLVHYVFIEEGTTTWCDRCPNVAGYLHDLYESGEYNFYYVSMVKDQNSKANDRLKNDYNMQGQPTVFVDGGYKVVTGQDKTKYAEAIRAAEKRDVPPIKLKVTVEYDDNTNEITTDVLVENFETKNYSGHLRVYLTEIISRWKNPYNADDGEPKPYHFGFIDYIIDKQTSIDGKGNTTLSDKRKLSDFDITNLVPEELMVIAVIFNSEPVKKYSYPPDEGEFDAYYADAADATELISGGNLRPAVGICLPDIRTAAYIWSACSKNTI